MNGVVNLCLLCITANSSTHILSIRRLTLKSAWDLRYFLSSCENAIVEHRIFRCSLGLYNYRKTQPVVLSTLSCLQGPATYASFTFALRICPDIIYRGSSANPPHRAVPCIDLRIIWHVIIALSIFRLLRAGDVIVPSIAVSDVTRPSCNRL